MFYCVLRTLFNLEKLSPCLLHTEYWVIEWEESGGHSFNESPIQILVPCHWRNTRLWRFWVTRSVAKPWVLGQPCCCVRPGPVGKVPGPSLPEDLQPSTTGAVLAVPCRGGTQKAFPVSSEYTTYPGLQKPLSPLE